MRTYTADRGPPEDGARAGILVTEQLSPRMSRLPNGSLLCLDVPIARVGWMLYGPGELPIPPGSDGMVHVSRTADELFSPETIGSFMAATVTDEHPPGDVMPDNWKRVAKGFTTTNVRVGTGDHADCLLADLVITDESLIKSVLEGKREVSCGYEADYYTTGPGMGVQTNIRGNHIALVRKGRCGPRCAIGDRRHPLEGNETMTKRTQLRATAARRALIDDPEVLAARQRVTDAQHDLEALEEDAEGEQDIHVHIHTADVGQPRAADDDNPALERVAALEDTVQALGDKMDAILAAVSGTRTTDAEAAAAAEAERLAALKQGAGGDTEGEDVAADPISGKTMDSAALANSYTELVAKCEVLVPGFRVPTMDAAAKRKATVDAMCGTRRRCLELAIATTDGAKLVESAAGTSIDLAAMDCKATAILFNAAVALKAASNNRAATADSGRTLPPADTTPKRASVSDINAQNRKFWEERNPTPA